MGIRRLALVAMAAVLGACGRENHSHDGAASTAVRSATQASKSLARATAFHDVDVKRHFLTSISDSEVDRILTIASEVLIKADGSGDVSADARIRRVGSIGTVTAGGGVITKRSEFDALFSSQERGVRQVRVVQQIKWCGEPGTFLGCADLTGYRIAVVRTSPEQDPLTWAHEFGHTIGLDHRDVRFALMRPNSNPENKYLNGSEAVAYLKISVQTPVSGTLRP